MLAYKFRDYTPAAVINKKNNVVRGLLAVARPYVTAPQSNIQFANHFHDQPLAYGKR
jgi:hypothetical protein